MNHFKFNWRTADNVEIFAQGWRPDDSPTAVVCLVHGLGEHSSRYAHVARAFCHAGFALLTFDHRGHGQSEGKRGHAPAYDDLLDDIGRLLREASQRFPHRPQFLYGHSLGGNLALNYALRREASLRGVIASSPWLKMTKTPPALQVRLVQAASRVWPALTFRTGLEVSAVSTDPTAVQAYATDPLIHDKISTRLFSECHQAGLWALARAHQFRLPLFLFHGSADRLTCPQASRQFAQAVPSRCIFKLWPELYHETHNEPAQDKVIAAMVGWVEAQLANAP